MGVKNLLDWLFELGRFQELKMIASKMHQSYLEQFPDMKSGPVRCLSNFVDQMYGSGADYISGQIENGKEIFSILDQFQLSVIAKEQERLLQEQQELIMLSEFILEKR